MVVWNSAQIPHDRQGQEINFYEVLGIPSSANAAMVKRSFRRRAQERHPDKGRVPQNDGSDEFDLLRSAYNVLSDPAARERYDQRNDWIKAHQHLISGSDSSGQALRFGKPDMSDVGIKTDQSWRPKPRQETRFESTDQSWRPSYERHRERHASCQPNRTSFRRARRASASVDPFRHTHSGTFHGAAARGRAPFVAKEGFGYPSRHRPAMSQSPAGAAGTHHYYPFNTTTGFRHV